MRTLWTLLVLGACQAPQAAPGDLGQVIADVFAHADPDDDRALRAATQALIVAAHTHDRELFDGVRVGPLDAGVVAPLTVGSRIWDGVGVAVATPIRHPVEARAWMVAEVTPDEVSPGKYLRFDRRWQGDPACFADADCDAVQAVDDVHAVHVGGLARVTYAEASSWRWVSTDYGDAVVRRLRALGPTDSSSVLVPAMEERYGLEAFLPWPGGGSLSLSTSWIVFGPRFELVDAALQQVVRDKQAEAADVEAWLDAR